MYVCDLHPGQGPRAGRVSINKTAMEAVPHSPRVREPRDPRGEATERIRLALALEARRIVRGRIGEAVCDVGAVVSFTER